MVNKYYENKKKDSKKKHVKDIRISQNKKKAKGKKARETYQNFTEEEKEKRCQNYRHVSKKYLSIEKINI